ncbi:glycoside hydrolase family 61 protein [Thelephora ganbajun]|uniref:Glycoside hydrolase family 61 protein n=1 Tax=Thelephora ganbajun TaxID=370292 RepID=A0ACB6ZR61_THEGA|nr:glycoside hydrolase family 61 protein [Thelephora ganbajun]
MKTFTLFLPFLTAALSLVPSVHAHGFVSSFDIDGTGYKGNIPSGRSDPSPIRQVTQQDPIYGATNPTINCGTGAPNAALVVDAMPGSKLTWDWRTASLDHWPHNTGPIMTYLASCGSTTCDSFDSRTAKWFKIDQAGRDSSGNWVQQQIMNGNVYSANLPKNLAPGQYLVRHEIIALHLATQKGRAEFYPSCQQIKVGGNGTGGPTQDELLSFPGSYSDDDPGIYTPNIYDPNTEYVFPGGPIAKFVTSSDGGNNGGTSTSISSSSTRKPTSTTNVISPPVPTGTGNPVNGGSSTCSLKNKRGPLKRSNWMNRRSDNTHPHRVSRVMGKLFHGTTW